MTWQVLKTPLLVQVLMATHLKRTESVVQPALFRFEEHFELQGLVGASRNSEVRVAFPHLTAAAQLLSDCAGNKAVASPVVASFAQTWF